MLLRSLLSMADLALRFQLDPCLRLFLGFQPGALFLSDGLLGMLSLFSRLLVLSSLYSQASIVLPISCNH